MYPMAARRMLNLPVLLVLCQVISEATSQQCSENVEVSILGMMLRNHIFKKITGAAFGDVCLRECYRDVRCQSFNYVFTQDMCELNNRTKEARPEDFVPNSERYYFRRDMNRVQLGSIPDLPADSCKEIKASEGGQAVSGKYWLDWIIPEIPVLAYCDMKIEDADECNAFIPVCDVNADCKNTLGSYRCSCRAGYSGDGHTCSEVDECSASIRVCDINANCQNTYGSYRCSCKSGFTGNGKTCKDIDECVSGVHDCYSSASCTNTVGSYSCTCNYPMTGDGKTCTHPECQNYNSLTSADRKITYGLYIYHCDSGTSGWYRFQGSAGTRMPTSCPPIDRCNTAATGWLNGGHPTIADGQVRRKVCFHWSSNCCYWSQYIKVRNCGAFYVYYLNSTPGSKCHLRYCSTD